MMKSLTMLLMMVMMMTVEVVRGEKCHHPPPAPGYTNTLYAGRWYEVGKYQTLGGAIFQQDTVCTIATYQPYLMTQGGGEVPDSGWSNLPAGHRLHHRHLPAVPHDPGWRGSTRLWVEQSSSRTPSAPSP